MLDADPAALTVHGSVTITADRITVCDFDGEGTSCRDLTALAMVWAIGRLQAELQATLERPGGGAVVVGTQAPGIPATGDFSFANALLYDAMEQACRYGNESYAVGKAAELLALIKRITDERDQLRAVSTRGTAYVAVVGMAGGGGILTHGGPTPGTNGKPK